MSRRAIEAGAAGAPAWRSCAAPSASTAEELDPTYDGATDAGVPFCQAGTGVPGCDADYRYRDRPAEVRDAVRSVQLTGSIRRPLVTVHGTLDTLLPPKVSSGAYTRLIDRRGLDARHRYYRVEDGNHVDGLYSTFPDRSGRCCRARGPASPRWCAGSSAGRSPRATGSSRVPMAATW